MVTMGLLNTLEGIESSQCWGTGGGGQRKGGQSFLVPQFAFAGLQSSSASPAVTSFQKEGFAFKIKEMKPYVGHTPVVPSRWGLQQEKRQFEATGQH